MKKIIVVGSINTDLVISAPYLPQSGETLTGKDFFTAHGGKGANQAVAAVRLGGNVLMCGCVGNDDFGDAALRSLADEGIDVSCIHKIDDISTGTAVIIITDGDNRIILDKGANACLSKSDIDEVLSKANKGDIFLTQLENPVDVVGYGLRMAKEKGLFVILNPAPANGDIVKYLSYCDLITPNESELRQFGGREKLLEKVPTVITTLGKDGYEIATKFACNTYPCVKVNAIDTTAAGDTLCGGLAEKLAEGSCIQEAAAFGSKAASIACTKKGAQPSIPTLNEVDRFS